MGDWQRSHRQTNFCDIWTWIEFWREDSILQQPLLTVARQICYIKFWDVNPSGSKKVAASSNPNRNVYVRFKSNLIPWFVRKLSILSSDVKLSLSISWTIETKILISASCHICFAKKNKRKDICFISLLQLFVISLIPINSIYCIFIVGI